MAFVNNLVLLEGFVAGEFKKIGENGPAVGQISVGKRVKDKETKEWVTRYEYYDVKGWSPAREQMLSTPDGSKVIVSGQLDRESWKDKTTDKTIYKTLVLVNTLSEIPKLDDGPSELPPARKPTPTQEWDF